MKQERANSPQMQQHELPLAFVHGEKLLDKPKDLFIPDDALEIKLADFTGPLDLLLYLIKKQKLDIANLPIATISEQYAAYIEAFDRHSLELSAEYLLMAATLVQIKSRLLLPKHEIESLEDDPRAELVKKLQEYKRIKQAAVLLDELPREERDLLPAHAELADNYHQGNNQSQVELAELINAFQQVLKRQSAYQHHHIVREPIATHDKMDEIIALLSEPSASGKQFSFTEVLAREQGRHGVVVSFLAILELIKEGKINCQQTSKDLPKQNTIWLNLVA